MHEVLCLALGIRHEQFLYGPNIYITLFLLWVAITNIDNKRQIIGIYCVSLKGEFLLPQLIYQGETSSCRPRHLKFPDGFHVTQIENHGSNERGNLAHLKKTIISHIEKVWK